MMTTKPAGLAFLLLLSLAAPVAAEGNTFYRMQLPSPLLVSSGSGPARAEATASAGENLDVSSAFSESVWASDAAKTLLIPEGVTIGSLDPDVPALMTGTALGGTLTIVNHGNIHGAGGRPNGGDGGDAIVVQTEGVTIRNAGQVYGGGGGGGAGGNGGAGAIETVTSEYPPIGFNANATMVVVDEEKTVFRWQGSIVATVPGNVQSHRVGNYRYERGAYYDTVSSTVVRYRIIRHTIQGFTPTVGGVAGDGGKGQGHDGPAMSGSLPRTGGAQAGTSGQSGAGGAWGRPGVAGLPGTAGNIASGLPGLPGGEAGVAIRNAGGTAVIEELEGSDIR